MTYVLVLSDKVRRNEQLWQIIDIGNMFGPTFGLEILQSSWFLHPKLYNINPHNVTHSLIPWNPRDRMFVVQISLPHIMNFVINAKNSTHTLILRQYGGVINDKIQPTPSYCAMCRYVECPLFLFILLHMPLVEMLVHGSTTLPRKAKWNEGLIS